MRERRLIARLKRSGVTINGVRLLCIDERAHIMPGVVIDDNVEIRGECVIEKGAYIGSGTLLENAHIGENTNITNSIIENAYIGGNGSVGPFAHVHKGSHVGDNIRIGNFVEIKNSRIGNGTKIAHLAYVGDADIGARCNIGCGAIFVNYDGVKKSRSKVGNEVFIGSNVNVIAPVTIDDNAYICAGSTVTIDIAKGDMCIARARETIKQGRGKYIAK